MNGWECLDRNHFNDRDRFADPFFILVSLRFSALPLGLDVGGVRTFSGYGCSPIVRTRFLRRLMRTLLRRGGSSGVTSAVAVRAPSPSCRPLADVSLPRDTFFAFFFFFLALEVVGVSISALASTSRGDPNASAARFFDFFSDFFSDDFSDDLPALSAFFWDAFFFFAALSFFLCDCLVSSGVATASFASSCEALLESATFFPASSSSDDA